MKVLGVHIGHDSSAALVIDGDIVADVAEERFSRIKHDSGLPIKAIEFCLKSQGITIENIDGIAIPALGSVPELNFLFDIKGDQQEEFTKQRRMVEFANRILNKPMAKPPLYIKNFPISTKQKTYHVEHHLAHAASAYYSSGNKEKQLIVTMDGAGDGVSIGIWRGENNKIEPLHKFPVSASLGWFYSNITEALGWWHGDGEGKTMGLAPYGDYNKAHGVLDKYYPKFKNGALIEEHDFDRVYFWNQKGAIQYHFDEAYEIKEIIEKYGREDIAAEAQRVLEEQAFEIILPWMEKEVTKNLTCAGGVFLNVKLNQRLWETGKIKTHHIFPNSGDSGLAAGAALYVYHQQNPTAEIKKVDDIYWGPEYSSQEIEAVLKLRNLKYKRIDKIEEFTAKKLSENKIVAWFQGRMESGPRALGNRSILMSSNHPENKDIINAKVKFREAFRPFCPSLMWEKREDYLEKSRDEDYMITSFTCKEEKRAKIPAVVHADNTLRPQTVRKEINERYWTLINEFGKITGEYLLLNTSLNIMGEPIINHPREAIRCFFDNGMDILVMDNFVLEKEV
jgi:carbamoyltransferase